MSYRPQVKADSNGTTQDLPLDAETVQGKTPVFTTTDQTISGTKSFTSGLKVSGRVANSGDDEGIVVNTASNGFAGVCLGNNSGRRSVFYLDSSRAFWRYNNGSTSYDLVHPGKSGTIATTSDIPTGIVSGTLSENTALEVPSGYACLVLVTGTSNYVKFGSSASAFNYTTYQFMFIQYGSPMTTRRFSSATTLTMDTWGSTTKFYFNSTVQYIKFKIG